MAEFEITERTEPFTLDEVFDFIDDTNIGKADAHELKSRIADMVQAERDKVIDETCLKLYNYLLYEMEWNRVLVEDWEALSEQFKEIAEQLKGGAE